MSFKIKYNNNYVKVPNEDVLKSYYKTRRPIYIHVSIDNIRDYLHYDGDNFILTLSNGKDCIITTKNTLYYTIESYNNLLIYEKLYYIKNAKV